MSLIIPNTFANRPTSIELSDLDDNFTYVATQLDTTNTTVSELSTTVTTNPLLSTLSVVNTTNLLLGSIEPATATTTPVNISLGGTYSSVAGQNLKLSLWSNAIGNVFGLGVSLNQLDYSVPSTASHVFYNGNVESLRIDSARNVGIGKSPSYKLDVATIALAVNQSGGVRFGYDDQFGMRLNQGTTGSGVPYAQIMGPKDGNGWLAFTMGSSDTERMRIDSSGNLFVGGTTQNTSNSPVYAKTTAKAWANWDGTATGTITPRANFNMSSITKSSAGTYIGNFTVALADANYASVSSNQPTSIGNVTNATHANSYPNNASSVNILHRAGGNTSSIPADVAQMSVIVFG
jgi:hypothetical protein